MFYNFKKHNTMNICFFPFYIDSESHHFKIMNFFKITTFFQNHEFLKITNFFKITTFFKITLFTKSRDFKITLFQNHAISKSRDFKITLFQNHIISKITLFLKSRDFFYHSLLFLKLPCFKKKFPFKVHFGIPRLTICKKAVFFHTRSRFSTRKYVPNT